ncbi:MAG: RDD family protein [Bdellovibrionales bacterium]
MVIESYQTRKTQLPTAPKSEFDGHGHRLASPADRLAAAILDWTVILTPVLLALVAPLRRQMLESVLFDTQAQFAIAAIWGVLLSLVLVFLYQTFLIYKFGATFGKMVFGLRVIDVWRQTRPGFEACALRSGIWIGEVLLLGLPWLSVFSNPLRRTMHDKLADTVVITTRRPAVIAPGPMQTSFVRGVYSAVLASFAAVLILSAVEIVGNLQNEDKLLGWLSQDRGERTLCEAVSEVIEREEASFDPEQRLQTAMELFAGGIISQGCLEQEADAVLNQNNKQSPLAYLAMAFAHSDDAERSNEYLMQACKMDQDGEPCHMTSIVQYWSSEDWGKVAELFNNLPANASPHVLVWKVRYLMRQGQYEQAMNVIGRLSGRSQLAEYLIPERVKALWRANHYEEARLVATTAFETLMGPERMNLSGWLCYEELARQCSPTVPSSCEQLIKDVHRDEEGDLQPSGWLAMVLIKEKCDGKAKSSDYAEIRSIAGPGPIESLVENLDLWTRGKTQEAKAKMGQLILDEKQPEAVRAEGLRRMIGWTANGDELKPWIKHWETLKAGSRRTLGPVLYRALKARGELGEALKVGWKLLDENRADLEINRDLVVTAYQMGRRKDAWALLKSYRERYDLLNNTRAPATVDEFVTISRLLSQEYGEK